MKKVVFLFFDTYIEIIKRAIGSRLFQITWALVDGKKQNVLKGGRISCATFVSSILILFGLIKERHATVAGTIKDMGTSGWKIITKPKIGCVLHWEKNGNGHEHVGFYIGNNKAISTSTEKLVPAKHHWKYGRDRRKIIGIYWHEKLDQ